MWRAGWATWSQEEVWSLVLSINDGGGGFQSVIKTSQPIRVSVSIASRLEAQNLSKRMKHTYYCSWCDQRNWRAERSIGVPKQMSTRLVQGSAEEQLVWLAVLAR